jgi:hypothetical protein
MKLTLKVDQGNGEYQVETNLFVIVSWERKYKRKASEIQSAGIGVEDLAFMAYEASKQAGVTIPAMFDDFIKRLVTLEVVEGEPATPTQGATESS